MSSSDKETELESLKEQEKLLAEKLSYFQVEIHKASNPAVKFELKKNIEESEQKLDEIKSQIAILEKHQNPSSVTKTLSYVCTIPLKNKKLFVIFVCTILAMVAYNSTWLGVDLSLNNQALNATMVMTEQQIPHQPDEPQHNFLEWLNKSLDRQQAKALKHNELYPKVWEETNAKHRFQTWVWIGSINFVMLASLISITSILLINNYSIRSKLFNDVNFVVIATFLAILLFTFKVPAVFFQMFLQSVSSTMIALFLFPLPFVSFGIFIFMLAEPFSYSQEIKEYFSRQKVYLFLSFTASTSISLGIFLGLLPHNPTTIIFLNGIALAVLLALSKRLFETNKINCF